MSNSKAVNEQLEKLLFQYESGAIDQSHYRDLRRRVVNGFAMVEEEETRLQQRRLDAEQKSSASNSSSKLAVVFTLILVAVAAGLIAFSLASTTPKSQEAKTDQPALADTK